MAQFESSPVRGGGRGFAFAGDLHSREGEFDAVLVERPWSSHVFPDPEGGVEQVGDAGHHVACESLRPKADRDKITAYLLPSNRLQIS